MKTGQGEMDTTQIESTAMDLFLPVMESAVVLAGHYCKACKRNVVTANDISYGLMYAARNVAGKQVGSLYPEAYDGESSDEEEEDEEDEDEEPWFRYEGTEDDMALKMNECASTWNTWNPTNPVERALKNAVDKNSFPDRE
jgi:histone H3/H4